MSGKIQNHPEIFERKESLVQIYKAHKHFPCNPSPSCIQRWFRVGVNTPHGRYKLETAVSGGKRFTSEEAILRFLVVQQGQPDLQANVLSVPTSAGMTAAERRREMKRLGLRPQRELKPDTPIGGIETGG